MSGLEEPLNMVKGVMSPSDQEVMRKTKEYLRENKELSELKESLRLIKELLVKEDLIPIEEEDIDWDEVDLSTENSARFVGEEEKTVNPWLMGATRGRGSKPLVLSGLREVTNPNLILDQYVTYPETFVTGSFIGF